MGEPTVTPVPVLVEGPQYSARELVLAIIQVEASDQEQEQDQYLVDHLAVVLLEVMDQVETLVVDTAQDQEDVDHLDVVHLEPAAICSKFWGLVGGMGPGPGLGHRVDVGGETMLRELMVGDRMHWLETYL